MSWLIDRLFALPYWGSLIVLGLALLVVVELGFRFGRRRQKAAADTRSMVSALVAVLVTLLGLLLGFSFSMVESRFAERKAIVIDEANAIGTAYLRAKLLSDPHGRNLQQDLRHYVNVRLEPDTLETLERAIRDSEIRHRQMWAAMAAVATAHPSSEIAGRAMAALNDVIDLHTTRVTVAFHQRLPRPIMIVLLLISVISMGLLGYWTGLEGRRASPAVIAVVASITLAIVMVNEIDDPLFQVSQSAMRDLQQMMADDVSLGLDGVRERHQQGRVDQGS